MRKLSFEENLRHRLRDLGRKSRRETSPFSGNGALFLAAGVVAGVAAGILLAQKYGGVGAVAGRVRDRVRDKMKHNGSDDSAPPFAGNDAHDHDYEDDEYDNAFDDAFDEALSPTEELEERVLEAYRNDPTLSERAVDIGALDLGIIELTGWVHSADEAKHAVTIARGTPGVETVVNRLTIRDLEDSADSRAERYASGDPSLNGGAWDRSSAAREAPQPPRAD